MYSMSVRHNRGHLMTFNFHRYGTAMSVVVVILLVVVAALAQDNRQLYLVTGLVANNAFPVSVPATLVAIDEAKAVLDRYLPPSAIGGTHDWDVARLHEPYGDGTYHGKLLKRVRKQLRSVGTREALTTPFLLRREWGR